MENQQEKDLQVVWQNTDIWLGTAAIASFRQETAKFAQVIAIRRGSKPKH